MHEDFIAGFCCLPTFVFLYWIAIITTIEGDGLYLLGIIPFGYVTGTLCLIGTYYFLRNGLRRLEEYKNVKKYLK